MPSQYRRQTHRAARTHRRHLAAIPQAKGTDNAGKSIVSAPDVLRELSERGLPAALRSACISDHAPYTISSNQIGSFKS